MNSDTLSGQWKQLMASARSTWAELTDNDVQKAQAGHDHLLGVLQERYGRSREQARQEIRAFLERHPDLQGTEKKDFFQKLSEMNGNMTINQYVENPAPGPSQRHGEQGENDVRGKEP